MVESFRKYLEFEKMASPLTLRAYMDDIEVLRQFLAPSLLQECDKAAARAFIISDVESGRSVASVNRRLSALKSFYDYLLRREVIAKNPFRDIRSLRGGVRLPNFVKREEIASVVEELKEELCAAMSVPVDELFESYLRARDATVVLLLYFTGMRREELVGLKCCDVDMIGSSVKVLGKGRKERKIPLSGEIVEVLKKYLQKRGQIICEDEQKSLFLRVKTRGKGGAVIAAITSSDVYKIVKRVLCKSETTARPSPHTLRHSFATHLLSSGVGVRSIQELLGHSSIASTQIYAYNTIESLKESYNNAHPRAVEKGDY
ncbi:MAG: tyrosine-type recombinase/integrase [Rikenellaceae bacterium]